MSWSWGGAGSGAASGAATGTAIMPGWGTAIGAGAGAIVGGLGGGNKPSVPDPSSFGSKDFNHLLPFWLRRGAVGQSAIGSGMEQIAYLLSHPGQFSPDINQAIGLRLSGESDIIGRNTANSVSQAAGAPARSGTAGTGFSQALQAALQRAGNQDMATARRNAMTDSEQMRRADLDQTYKMLDALLQFTNSARGKQGQTLALQTDISKTNYAANQAQMAQLFSTLGNIKWPQAGNVAVPAGPATVTRVS